MSAFNNVQVKCACSHSFPYHIALGINVERSPKFRQQILDGTFHTAKCPSCNTVSTVETSFSYTDPKRKLIIQVKPRKQFSEWKAASDILAQKVKRIPEKNKVKNPTLRVVFGLAELREKLICQDIRLSDSILELIKTVLLYEHPFLIRRPRLQFTLIKADKNELQFRATHMHDKRNYLIILPRTHVKNFEKEEGKYRKLVGAAMKGNNPFDNRSAHYMSYQRFLPQTNALAELRKYAATIKGDGKVNMKSAEFKLMLYRLPRGTHLSTDAKNDLKTLQQYANKFHLQIQGDLWEVRFGKELESEFWKNHTADDIATLWKVFEKLPVNHIEGNNTITEVKAGTGGGGTYDTTNGEIEIGIKEFPEHGSAEDTIRHEVGHSVHKQQHKKVQDWLESRFGWKLYNNTFSGFDKWVQEMNGWGNATAAEKRDAYRCIKHAFQADDDWGKGEIPDYKSKPKNFIWNRKDFLPRKVYEETHEAWYSYFTHWYHDGKRAFFLNYYYDMFCIVNRSTLNLIKKMPSHYAAMSDQEFFAELYALHHDKYDERRKHIPEDVKQWLDNL